MGRMKDTIIDREHELDYDNYVEYPECQRVFDWHAYGTNGYECIPYNIRVSFGYLPSNGYYWEKVRVPKLPWYWTFIDDQETTDDNQDD